MRLERFTLSDKEGVIKFSQEKDMENHIIYEDLNDKMVIEVQTTTLDKYCTLNSFGYHLYTYNVKENKLISTPQDYKFDDHHNYFAIKEYEKVSSMLQRAKNSPS